MTWRFRNLVFSAVLLFGVIAATEIMAFCSMLLMGAERFAPEPTRDEFLKDIKLQYNAENFDPVLGWIATKSDREKNGERISPENHAFDRACLSLYGDSFVFGDEVSHEAAWGNQLARRLKCQVLNYGVGGYGTDQAYLRFEKNVSDRTPLVVLGILSENIVRNVNQNRAFLYNSGIGPIKPVFWFDGSGVMQLAPLPRFPAESYETYLTNPKLLFEHDYFIPGSSYDAKQRMHFPYTLSLIKALRYKRVRDGLLFYFLDTPPWYSDFYRPFHPSHAFPITQNIIDRFVEKSISRQQLPAIFFFPTSRDIIYFLQTGSWTYGALYEWCHDRGYLCFDIGSALIKKLGAARLKEEGICKYFCTARLSKQGHYTEEGNVVLADIVMQFVQKVVKGNKN